MATATSNIPANVRLNIIGEAGALDCMIVDTLAGCYGSYAYMEQEVGITPARCARAMQTVTELPAFIKQEHGIDITERQIIDVMREAHERMTTHWERQWD